MSILKIALLQLMPGADAGENREIGLRACREDRDRYADEKRRLAGRQWAYVQDYADAKTAVVGEILERIRQAGLLPN